MEAIQFKKHVLNNVDKYPSKSIDAFDKKEPQQTGNFTKSYMTRVDIPTAEALRTPVTQLDDMAFQKTVTHIEADRVFTNKFFGNETEKEIENGNSENILEKRKRRRTDKEKYKSE